MMRFFFTSIVALVVACGPPADPVDPVRIQPNNGSTNASSNTATNNASTGTNTATNNASTGTNASTNNADLPTYEPRAWRIGQSVLERTIIAEQHGDEGPVLLVFSAIHGDERPSVTFAERWRVMLQSGLAQRTGTRIVFVPFANPDGIAVSTRRNVNDIDLNRNFPADNFEPGGPGGDEPLSEPETRALKMVIDAVQPSAVVSAHCCVPTFDYDGPGEDLANTMAAAMDPGVRFPVVRLGSLPGSMGSYVGIELGLPIITLEFQDDSIDTEAQLQNIEEAMTAAAEWVAQHGDDPEIVIAEELTPAPSAEFQSFVYGESSGGVPLRADDFLDGAGRVLLLSGVNDNDRRALNAAEHVRRVALSELADDQIPFTVVTAPNPDGIRSGRTVNDEMVDIAMLPESTPEVEGLLDLVEARPPALTVLIEADDQSDNVTAWDLELGQVGAYAPTEWALVPNIDRSSPLVQTLRQHGPVIRVGVQTKYAEGVGTDPALNPAPVSDFVRDVALRFGP